MARLYDDNSLSTGNTPLVRLNRVAGSNARVYAKIEGRNPAYSVKCRIGAAMVQDAEARGVLKPGMTIVEPTSGNTGIALAFVAAARGYAITLTMPASMSLERRKALKALGASLVLTDPAKGMKGAIEKASEIVVSNPTQYFMPQQFENPANPAYHRSTTAAEILQDFAGRQLDYFVSGWGTGGTLTGVGEMLKLARPDVKIVTTEPAGAALLAGKEWQPHKIQGWTPDFIPAVLNRTIADENIPVDDITARDTARRLASEEGVFVGISAGATLAAALIAAENAPEGSVILAMLPDTGERYLSTFLFEGVNEGSDDEWLAAQ